MSESIQQLFLEIYGPKQGPDAYLQCVGLLNAYRSSLAQVEASWSEKDAILITYADQFRNHQFAHHLQSLGDFYMRHLRECINSIHFLPFFPFTSDDGFSVVDYRKIDPNCGTWEDVHAIAQEAKLMFDAVVNHCSKSSPWFIAYLKGEPEYQDYFINVDPKVDTSLVIRPRALPLLHPFHAHDGERHIWTTFSEDQVDLNVANPKVLIDIIDILLTYVQHGAQFIRLDAIAFLWKELGTTCLHHPKTHLIVKLFRAVYAELCHHVKLITETNVPHTENLSYFGNGHDEAQLVYNFTLPPLLAWSILKEQCCELRTWAQTLKMPSDEVCLFNFTASHDGIGMRPLQGILPPTEIEFLAEQVLLNGGRVSYKDNGDGTKSPYELNCNYMDILSSPDECLGDRVAKFCCSQAIMLAMPGIPGIYVHSILGSGNDFDELAATGRARSINRAKFTVCDLERELSDPMGRRRRVLDVYKNLLKHRSEQKAFHPLVSARYPDFGASIFAIQRGEGRRVVLCLFNLSGNVKHAFVAKSGVDLLTGERHRGGLLRLDAWGVVWLKE